MSELNCCFRYSLGNSIVPGCVRIAKFDGKSECIVAATKNGKIQLFNPSDDSTSNSKYRYININKEIICLETGTLDPNIRRDMLMIGTESTLQAYDVEDNRDLFYSEITDGIKTMTTGNFLRNSPPLCLVGGNCSILGYNHEGNDVYWSVTGDDVTCMTFLDINSDGDNELLVASKDFDVKFMKNEEVVSEYTESCAMITVSPYVNDIFIYGLSNGNIGVCQYLEKKWSIQSKHISSFISTYDINLDGINEIVVGYNTGLVNILNPKNGCTMYKDQFPNHIAGMMTGGFRGTKSGELIIVDTDGMLRGYDAIEPTDYRNNNHNDGGNDNQLTLMKKKKELENHLKALKDSITLYQQDKFSPSVLSSKTIVSMAIDIDEENKCVSLTVESTENTVISCIHLKSDDGVIASESQVFYLDTPTNKTVIPIVPIKYQMASLEIEAIVSPQGYYEQFSVLHNFIELPKFSLFTLVDGEIKISSFVNITIQERINRLVVWLEESFMCLSIKPLSNEEENINITMKEIEKNLYLKFVTDAKGNSFNLTIYCDDIEIAAEVIQCLCHFLSIDSLSSTAYFPLEMDKFRKVIETVESCNQNRQTLTLDIADDTNLLKSYVIKAEDSRILNDMDKMMEYYREIESLNRKLLLDYHTREKNQMLLVDSLKQVNLMIQKGANLRLGEPKSQVVSLSRNAVKENRLRDIIRYIEQGN